jgi:uncharacterized membrane protein
MVDGFHFWAVCSGFLGALAAVLAKLTFDSDSVAVTSMLRILGNTTSDSSTTECERVLAHFLDSKHHLLSLTTLQSFRMSSILGDDPLLGASILVRCLLPSLMVRVLCFVGMLVTNMAMLATFLDGMIESGSVAGSALSTGTNFVTSAILGVIFFQEKTSVQWYIGFVMVLSGTVLLSQVKTTQNTAQESKKES